MRHNVSLPLVLALLFSLVGCNASVETAEGPPAAPSPADISNETIQPEDGEEQEGEPSGRRIRVQCGDVAVLYQLNDSPAADSLYEQLPLTVAVEDYSTNEKIFYPPRQLDTDSTPLAQGGAGTLAYYAPWGDVVLFYDDYSENAALYALGQAVSGENGISQLSGTITIDRVS